MLSKGQNIPLMQLRCFDLVCHFLLGNEPLAVRHRPTSIGVPSQGLLTFDEQNAPSHR